MGEGSAADLAVFVAFGSGGATDLGAADLGGIFNESFESFDLILFGCLQQLSTFW